MLGRPEQLAAGAEPLDGAVDAAGRASSRASCGSTWSPARSCRARAGRATSTSTPRVHVDPDGEMRAVYRKLHMFDVEVAGIVYRESDGEDPGEEIVTTTLADGAGLGMADLLRPALPRAVPHPALRGARMLALPSAFTLATTRDHWEVLLRARAIENQAFVVAANQIGEHPPGNASGGRSLIVDPWGDRARAGARRRGLRRRRARLRRARTRSARDCRRSRTAARRAYAWPDAVDAEAAA